MNSLLENVFKSLFEIGSNSYKDFKFVNQELHIDGTRKGCPCFICSDIDCESLLRIREMGIKKIVITLPKLKMEHVRKKQLTFCEEPRSFLSTGKDGYPDHDFYAQVDCDEIPIISEFLEWRSA